jgi:hypothetical protein
VSAFTDKHDTPFTFQLSSLSSRPHQSSSYLSHNPSHWESAHLMMLPFSASDPTMSDEEHEVLIPSNSHDNDAANESETLPRRHLGPVSTVFLM